MGSKLLKLLLILVLAFVMWGVYQTGIKLSTQKTPFIQNLLSKKKDQPAQPQASSGSGTEQNKAPQPAQVDQPEQPQAPSEPSPIMVRVFKMKPTDFRDFLPVMGTVKGKTEVELKFEVPGVIKKIYFREGEKIKKGALIAYLVPDDAKLKLKYARNKFISAQAAYESSLKKYEINQKLFEVGAIIKSKMEEAALDARSAKAQVDTAKAEEDLAKNDFRKVFLYANKEGLMGPREAEEGEFVTSQDKMATLLEISEVYIEVGIVERDINKVRLGQTASIYVDAYPNLAFEGTVDSVYPIIEGKSRTLTAKIKVDNKAGMLMPGMFSRAEISIADLKQVLIIPTSSIMQAGGGKILVPVVPKATLRTGEDGIQTGVVQIRRVVQGYATNDYVQVSQGLGVDDLIVIETQGELKDNAKVKIVGTEELGI